MHSAVEAAVVVVVVVVVVVAALIVQTVRAKLTGETAPSADLAAPVQHSHAADSGRQQVDGFHCVAAAADLEHQPSCLCQQGPLGRALLRGAGLCNPVQGLHAICSSGVGAHHLQAKHAKESGRSLHGTWRTGRALANLLMRVPRVCNMEDRNLAAYRDVQ